MSLQKKIRDLQKNLENETSVNRYNYDTLLDRIHNLDVKLNSLNSQPLTNLRRNRQNRNGNNSSVDQPGNDIKGAKGAKVVKGNTLDKPQSTIGRPNPVNKHKKICVFDKCPPGTGEKHKLLYGQVKVADGSTMCTFKECPINSIHVGDMANVEGNDNRRLCVFEKCPSGSYPLASYIKKK